MREVIGSQSASAPHKPFTLQTVVILYGRAAGPWKHALGGRCLCEIKKKVSVQNKLRQWMDQHLCILETSGQGLLVLVQGCLVFLKYSYYGAKIYIVFIIISKT